MGRRGKSAKKAARAARAAARRAAEEELRAAVEREGDERRQAAYSVAKDFFVKLLMSGIKLRMLHFRGKPDTPVGAQKWGAKLLPDRNLSF